MSVNLHIERLILDGLSVSDAQGPIISAAVEKELTRLLAAGGLERSLQSGGAWPSVPVSNIRLTAGQPAHLGHQIAAALYGGIGQEQSSTLKTQQGYPHANPK
jgi:hypothetical protein